MAHDLFISHSSKDKTISDAICAALEGAGIRCWIAPRDVQPGRSFAGEINRAIQHSKVMVLVFSASSNNSEQVLREVQLAVNSHLHILQFRIEDVRLNDDLEYFLSTPHWLDAMEPPLEKHIGRLKTSVKALLDAPVEQSIAAAAPTETQTQAPVAEPFGSASSSSQMRDAPAAVPQKREVSTARTAPSPPVNRGRKFLFAGAIVALLAAGVLAGWWFEIQQPRKEKPFQNSLGMKFMPVPGTQVLFSIWDTRVQDYQAFAIATQRDWPKPTFEQGPTHPAVNVSWEDATAFCEWLTDLERKEGMIGANQAYRLPTDLEWSAAVGLEKESGETPEARNGKVGGVYPWGTKWPPPKGAGNYDPSLKVDDYGFTSPVGSFEPNRFGLYDMGGNVWQWCEDWYDNEKLRRVLRGASWLNEFSGSLLSSYRLFSPTNRYPSCGFRLVVAGSSSTR